ncbi:MAG TPA: MlaD family protein [Tepidisphaeraceae bacterium]|nr:MlaD family protein [Tepidisphaeraceae bacterium]
MNKSRYFKIGIFVLVGLALICTAIIVLGAGRWFERKVLAETLFDQSVDGLEVGAPVKYRGVTIGRVTSIAFADTKHDVIHAQPHQFARDVLVDMSLDARSFQGMNLEQIRDLFSELAQTGLRARISQQGLAGGVYIGLDFVQNAPAPPSQVKTETAAIYIPSAPGTMAQVMSAADRLASDLQRANLPRIVEHFDTLVTSATGTVNHVDDLVEGNRQNIKTVVADLPLITGNLKGTVARTNQLLHDQRVDQTLGNVAQGSASAGDTIKDLRLTSQELRTLISTRQEDIQQIISDLRRTADNLAALSVDARDNPSRLLLGQPPQRKPAGE